MQWKEEIETKTNEMFSVRLHHGKDKVKVRVVFCLFSISCRLASRRKHPRSRTTTCAFCSIPLYYFPLTRPQVIITTYQTLSLDFHVPKDTVDVGDEAQYLAKHGCVSIAPPLACY